jgi:hypothetical protein
MTANHTVHLFYNNNFQHIWIEYNFPVMTIVPTLDPQSFLEKAKPCELAILTYCVGDRAQGSRTDAWGGIFKYLLYTLNATGVTSENTLQQAQRNENHRWGGIQKHSTRSMKQEWRLRTLYRLNAARIIGEVEFRNTLHARCIVTLRLYL